MGTPDGAGPGRPQSRAFTRRHPVPGSCPGGAQSGVVGRRVPGGDRRRHRGHRRSALVHPAARGRFPAGGFHPGAARQGSAAAVPQAAAGPLRAVVADARLRAAGTPVPRVPGHLVAGRARLLPQVHGRRAHAADDSQLRAARQHRPNRPGSASRRLLRASRRPSSSSSRCCCTTWGSGATTSMRSRANAWR